MIQDPGPRIQEGHPLGVAEESRWYHITMAMEMIMVVVMVVMM